VDHAFDRAALLVALIAAALLLVVGIRFGTFTAGGSDSYCYLNGAELLARGVVMDVEPLAADPGWPGTKAAFAPTGHAATPSGTGAVPICPSGYPLLMAAARLLAGRDAMFLVTPIMGAALVMIAFALGRALAGPLAGASAAILAAASPIVLYQVVQPMNDIAAAAAWGAVLLIVLSDDWSPQRRSVAAGLCAGVALTIRPNLLPLAAWCGLGLGWLPQTGSLRERCRAVLLLGIGTLPGVVFILAIQSAMYGSPFRSGYGDLDHLFSIGNMGPNVSRYIGWLAATQTPLVALALIAPLVVLREMRRRAVFLLGFTLVTLACYLPYVVFDAWWYLRFLLPALVPILVLMTATIAAGAARLRLRTAAVVIAAVTGGLAVHYVGIARDRQAFELERLEARFRTAGAYVATLPENAIIVTEFQSGSVRFYSGRRSVLWGELAPDRLPDALMFLKQKGLEPYFLFERWEEPLFRERFAKQHPLGTLEWPPIADIDRSVRVFDPDDYVRYMRGEYVRTEQVRSPRE
jgi:hypothetical protein